MVDIDSETLFNAAAAAVATIAVVFFIVNVEWGYSPVSKVALVVLFLAGVFALTQRTDDHQLTLFGYGVIVTSAIALFFEAVGTFGVGEEGTVFGLLVIAALLFGVRTRLDEENHFVTGKRATYALGVLAVVVVAVLVVDVATGGLAYELQTQGEVTVPESHREQLRVASLVVTNPTPFPERVETPNYAACAAGNWSAYRHETPEGERSPPVRVGLNVQDGYNEHVMGFSSRTFPVGLYIEGEGVRGETFPVERTSSCPDTETGAPYIAVYERDDDRRFVSLA